MTKHAELRGFTHKEKDARMRGALVVIETACKRLANEHIDFQSRFLDWQSTLQRDYVHWELLRRLEQLEQENGELKRQNEGKHV